MNNKNEMNNKENHEKPWKAIESYGSKKKKVK